MKFTQHSFSPKNPWRFSVNPARRVGKARRWQGLGSSWQFGTHGGCLALVLTLVCGGSASAQTNTWTGTTSGVLNVSGNYAAGASVASDGNPSALYVFGNNTANRYSLTNGAEFKVNRFEFTGSNSYTIANTGQFNFVGVGGGITQSSSANQTISGGIKVSDGPFTLSGNGTGLVTLSGTGNDYAGKGVTKSGTSAFLITAAITAPGTVTINGGTLAFSGTGNLASAYQLRGGVIATSGTFSRTVGTTATSVNFAANSNGGFAAYGGALTVSTNLGTWGSTASSLTATSQLILGSSIADNVVTLSSALNLGAAARTIQLVDNTNSANDSAAISGIISGTGGLNLTGAGTLALSNTNTYTGVTTIGSAVTLAVGSIGNGGVAGNLGQAAVAAGNLVLSGGTLRYTGATASTNRNFTLGAATTSVIHVSSAATVLTMTGASATSTGIINKTGEGVLSLSAANAHTGGTVLTTGTLRATANAGALGNGTLTLSGGILDLVNDSGLTFGRNTTVTANTQINSRRTTAGAGVTHSLGTLAMGAQTLTTGTDATVSSGTAGVTFGSTTLSASGTTFTSNAGTLLTLGAVTGTNTSFTVNGEGNTTLSGIVGTGTGGLTKAGGGILTLSANNTRTGVTTINGGTLSVATINDGGIVGNLGQASNDAANLVLAGGALRYTGNTASTNRNFTLGAATTSSIEVSTATLTMTGASAATTGALTKAGAGTLVLTGANGHTGGTTISAGTLQVGNAGTIGSLSASGVITNNSALSFNRTDTVTQGTNFGSIAGSGTVTQAGGGTLILGSANSYSGTTAVNAGVLRVTNATGLGTTAAGTTVASGAALELSGGITIGAEALSLSGSGIASGGALRSVSGNNTYGGAITGAANSLIMVDTGVLTLNGVVSSTFDTTFDGAGNAVAAAGVTGGGNVIKTGSGTLTLAVNSGHANTTVNQGQLNINSLTALGTPAGTLTLATGTLIDNTSGSAVTVANPKSIALGSNFTFVGSNNLNLGSGTVTLAGNTAINVSASELTFGGNVTGSGFGITKTGAGILRLDGLTGAGSFSGNSFVNAGKLVLGGTSTLGGSASTSVTVADGAFLEILSGASAGNVTLVSRPGGLITSSVVVANQDFTTSGTLTPSNANFNGIVDIASGVTIEASANFFGVVPSEPTAGRIVFESNSTLNATAGFTINANQGISLAGGNASFGVNPSQALIIDSAVAGSGGIVKVGSGNMRLTGVNTYTGGTVVSAGILGITNGQALGAVSGALKLDGGTLVGAQVTSGDPISAVTIAAERSLVLANGKTSGMDAQSGLSLRYDGVIAEENGGGAASGLRIGSSAARTGTVILGGNNTYQGATTVDFGILSVATIGNGGVAGNLGAASNAAENLVLGGGSLQYTGASAATDRSFTLTSNTSSGIEVATSGTTLILNGASAATSGALNKTGLGTLQLNGANAHTGATNVEAGKLIVNGSTSAASAVGVSSGATLAGSGAVGGNTTISSGGVLAPGNSPGVLTVSGTTALESGSIFEWELDTAQSNPTTNRGVAYDGINTTAVTGTGAIFKILLTGTQDFSDYAFWGKSREWTDIFKSANGSTTLSDWAPVFSGGFQYSYNGKTVAPTVSGTFTLTGNSLTWSAVPEPSNALAGLLAACALLRRRRCS